MVDFTDEFTYIYDTLFFSFIFSGKKSILKPEDDSIPTTSKHQQHQ